MMGSGNTDTGNDLGELVNLMTREINPVPFVDILNFVKTHYKGFQGYRLDNDRQYGTIGGGELTVSAPTTGVIGKLTGQREKVIDLHWEYTAEPHVWKGQVNYADKLVKSVLDNFKTYQPVKTP